MNFDTAEPAAPGWITNEIRRFLAAVQYFTRLPVPSWVGHSQALLDDAARYFPLVGLLVGLIGAATLWALSHLWSNPIAVVISIMATLLVTGAFHEDGLADAVDGLGGSLDRARSLEIMKDSRIGVFGAAALVVMLGLKFAILGATPMRTAALMLIGGHTVSRLGGVLIMATLPYVRDSPDSRSRPLVHRISIASIFIGCLASALAVSPLQLRGLTGTVSVLGICLLWRAFIKHRLGGYTGDCLGAAQQLGECGFYLACAANT